MITALSLLVNAFLIIWLFRRRPDPSVKGLTSIGLRQIEDKELTDYDRVLLLAEEIKKINWHKVDPLQVEALIELVITLVQEYEGIEPV